MKFWQGREKNRQYRLPGYDYSSDGYYFVTICTEGGFEFFGEIRDGIMQLNKIGHVVTDCWNDISKKFKKVELKTWQIMPNHLHGIIVITNDGRSMINHGPTSKYTIPNCPMQMAQPTLGTIIRWFKGRSSRLIRKTHNPNFSWQPRFHDHIIRNEDELNRIHTYVQNNPVQWEWDRNNPQGEDCWF